MMGLLGCGRVSSWGVHEGGDDAGVEGMRCPDIARRRMGGSMGGGERRTVAGFTFTAGKPPQISRVRTLLPLGSTSEERYRVVGGRGGAAAGRLREEIQYGLCLNSRRAGPHFTRRHALALGQH
jgi:hypothetical protein